MSAMLPVGETNGGQSLDDYVETCPRRRGCRFLIAAAMRKIHRVLDEMEAVRRGLTRGFDLSILDRGYGDEDGGCSRGSASPGCSARCCRATRRACIHYGRRRSALKTPIAQSRAGGAVDAAANDPGVHRGGVSKGGVRVLSDGSRRGVGAAPGGGRAMLFGSRRRAVGEGFSGRVARAGLSKVVLGTTDGGGGGWEQHIDLMFSSIAANGGRSCINASAVWTPANGRRLPRRLAQRCEGRGDAGAIIRMRRSAAFANPQVAERINASIDEALQNVPGAEDFTAKHRGSPRLVRQGQCALATADDHLVRGPQAPAGEQGVFVSVRIGRRMPPEEIPARHRPVAGRDGDH